VLLGESPGPLPMMCEPSIPGLATVMEVCDIQQQYWKIDPLSIMTMRSQFKSRVKGKLSLLLMHWNIGSAFQLQGCYSHDT
jgi:hypothetical protein